jgi:sporulation protein YlmC with PRC-barrel domain
MRVRTIKWTVISVATALWAQAALAQADQSQSQQSGQKEGAATSSMGSSSTDIRFSKLKGTEIKSQSGDSLGKVEDALLNPRTGTIQFIILDRGGVLGVGDKHLPVPWKAVSVQSEKELTLNMDKQKLDTAPTVKKDYSELNDPQYTASVYEFYGIQHHAMGGAMEAPGGAAGGSSESNPENPPSPPPAPAPAPTPNP